MDRITRRREEPPLVHASAQETRQATPVRPEEYRRVGRQRTLVQVGREIDPRIDLGDCRTQTVAYTLFQDLPFNESVHRSR